MNTPRKGQWVKLTRDIDLGGEVEKTGTVGIHVTTREQKDGTPVSEIHLVKFPEGTTRKICGIHPKDLEPVLIKDELPSGRVKTMHPTFELKA